MPGYTSPSDAERDQQGDATVETMPPELRRTFWSMVTLSVICFVVFFAAAGVFFIKMVPLYRAILHGVDAAPPGDIWLGYVALLAGVGFQVATRRLVRAGILSWRKAQRSKNSQQ